MLHALCETLITASPATASDLIVVLGGRSERHLFGLQLWRSGLAPRLLLSIGRFDARRVAPSLPEPSRFLDLVRATPPRQRHFFADYAADVSHYCVAQLSRRGTYPELQALASYLEPSAPATITIASTSIHLRRIRFCCRRIPFFQDRTIYYLPVPEEISSFRREAWWTRFDHCSYVAKEYGKLALYSVIYRRSQKHDD